MKLDLLAMRCLLLNVAGIVLLWYGIDSEVVLETFALDTTYISESIVFVFVCAMFLAWYHTYWCSRALNDAVKGKENPYFPTRREAYIIYTEQPIVLINRLQNIMLLLGLAGTMYGLTVAVSGVDVARLGSIDDVGSELSKMIGGIHVVFVTTLTGILSALWTGLHLTMLENAYRKLFLLRGGHVST